MNPPLSQPSYRELKEFFSFYSSHYMPIDRLPPELRPVACLEALEKKGTKFALRGLRQAVNDIIERCRHMNHGEVAKLDAELRKRGLNTLSEVRKRYSRDYARIIRKGKIANETEYYLIRGIIADDIARTDSDGRDALEAMALAFEGRAVKK